MTFTGTTTRPAARTLPRNVRALLPELAMEQVCTAYEIADERLRAARVQFGQGHPSYSRWLNLAADIREHAFQRGYSFSRWADRYVYNRIEAAG